MVLLFICKKSVPFLFVATVSSLLYLLCLKFNLMDFFHALLERVGFSLGGRALSFALRGLGCCCSAGLALTVGFALRALLTGEDFTHMMIPFGEGTSGASSSESPATPASPSDSLIGHASSETDSDKERFFTPPQSVSSASSSSTSTPGIESAPNNGQNEERDSFTYIKPGSHEHEAMKKTVLVDSSDNLVLKVNLDEFSVPESAVVCDRAGRNAAFVPGDGLAKGGSIWFGLAFLHAGFLF